VYSLELGIRIKTTIKPLQESIISLPSSLNGSFVFAIGWANQSNMRDPKKDIAERLIKIILTLAPSVYACLNDDAFFFSWTVYELKSEYFEILCSF
jgi:hypothetical protein